MFSQSLTVKVITYPTKTDYDFTWYWGGRPASLLTLLINLVSLSALLTLPPIPLSTLVILSSACDTAEYCLVTGLLMASQTLLISLNFKISGLSGAFFIWNYQKLGDNIGMERMQAIVWLNCLLWACKHSWLACCSLPLRWEPIECRAFTERNESSRLESESLISNIYGVCPCVRNMSLRGYNLTSKCIGADVCSRLGYLDLLLGIMYRRDSAGVA